MPDSFLSMWENNRGIPFDVFLREAPIMAHSINDQGTIINVSQFWADRLGYKAQEMIGSLSVDFLTPESRTKALEEYLPRFHRDGRLSNARYTFVAREGREVPVIMSAIALSEDGKFTRSLAVMFDNGIAARLREIDAVLSNAHSALSTIADKAEGSAKEDLERIVNQLIDIRQD